MARGCAGRTGKRICAVNLVVAVGVVLACTPRVARGQWLKYPTADVPRTADGKPNLRAPVPRLADGKPDFSGIWLTATKLPCTPGQEGGFFDCGLELPISPMAINIGAGVPGGLPY